MKVLLVTMYFPPSGGGGVQRPLKFATHLPALGVETHEAVFVGDGANDELEGARRVGMDAILIHRPGERPLWGLDDWDGPRVTSIPGVLDLLD